MAIKDSLEKWQKSICPCILEYSLSLAATEALEHNAMVGGIFSRLGLLLKDPLPEDAYEAVVIEFPWLEEPIKEPLAELFGVLQINQMGKICNVDTSEVHEHFQKGKEANRNRQYGAAQQHFIEAKMKLVELAEQLCKRDNPDNPGRILPPDPKLPRRKVLAAWTVGVTKQGNPKTYYFLLECGHTLMFSHHPHWATNLLLFEMGKPVYIRCDKCGRGDERWIAGSIPLDLYLQLPDEIKKLRPL